MKGEIYTSTRGSCIGLGSLGLWIEAKLATNIMYSFPKFIIGYAFVNDSKIVYHCD